MRDAITKPYFVMHLWRYRRLLETSIQQFSRRASAQTTPSWPKSTTWYNWHWRASQISNVVLSYSACLTCKMTGGTPYAFWRQLRWRAMVRTYRRPRNGRVSCTFGSRTPKHRDTAGRFYSKAHRVSQSPWYSCPGHLRRLSRQYQRCAPCERKLYQTSIPHETTDAAGQP
jgi:hypothetical protein